MNSRRLRLIGVGLTACAFGLLCAEQLSAEVRLFGKKPPRPMAEGSSSRMPAALSDSAVSGRAPTSDANERDSAAISRPASANGKTAATQGRTPEQKIKLNYLSKNWDDVLKDVAKQSGHVLVIDKVPPGRFSRNDWTPHSFTESLRILNRELEPKGFRLLERGQFLDLVFLRDARQEYSRPVLDVGSASRRHDDNEDEFTPPSNDTPAPRQASRAKPNPKTLPETPPGLSKTGNSGIVPASAKVLAPPRSLRPTNAIELAAHANPLEDDDNEKEVDADWLEDAPPKSRSRWIEVVLQHQSSRSVSRSVYQAFVENAELVEQGPGGLPGFVVWQDASRPEASQNAARGQPAVPKRVRFTIGIDLKKDRLLIDGSPTEVAGLRRLIAKLDVAAKNKYQSVKLITSKRDVREVAQALRPAVKQLALEGGDHDSPLDENDPLPKAKVKTKASSKKPTAKPKTAAKGNSAAIVRRELLDLSAEETDEPQEAKNSKTESRNSKLNGQKPASNDDAETETKPAGKADVPAIIGGLKGDVNVEAMDDLGVLILRGNEQDVEAVMSIIRQIEKLSAGATPDIHLRMLDHVDSESLAELLTSVYERLNRTRGRSAQDTSQVTVIAVGKPNSVLILASQNDIEAVNTLIDKLDQPVDPNNEFEVFRLRYAIASQVITAIDSFFGSGTTSTGGQGQAQGQGTTSRSSSGLRGRVRTISDSRTNAIIVQARPRDLEEVRRLIDELDQVGNQAVNQIKLIPLKNAVAEELSEILNLAIQSTISPPQQARSTQGGGQGFGGGGGQGQVDQKLREAKSAVLQLLEDEGGDLVESGILADIRINPDSRTNSLVVTAPEESLALIQALVRKFDIPASLVAEIKHFMMKNADAQSVSTMLNQLFNNQQQTGQRGAGGNQQNQQLGVQLAGAEDASSQLIPLKFSTDIRTNSIIAVGGAEALSVVEAIILRLDASDVRQRKNTVYRLKNSPAQEVATAITLFLQGQRDLANQGNQDLISNVEQLEREIIVVAEPNSNSLLISATPRYYKDITEMVERIDAAKPEVVIQALLVEVTLDNTDEFGIELGFQDRLLFNRSLTSAADITTISQTNTSPNGVATTTQNIVSQAATPGFLFNTPTLGNNVGSTNASPSTVAGQSLSTFGVGRTNGNLGFGGLVLSAGSESVNVLLRALSSKRKLEILSRPQIRTLDSQLGRINVGQIVPVVSGITSSGIAGQFVPQVIRDQSGIVLNVTPRITPDDRIVMLVFAERSNYNLSSSASVTLVAAGAGTGAITSPVKDNSTVETTVSVANEQTIVIGGLIQKTDDQITRKVPWLGDIPVLGQAFRYDAHLFKRTELLIFLTPRIVKNDSVSEIIKQIESERMHYTECEAEAIHGPLFVAPAPPSDGSTSPVYAPGGMWIPPAPQGTVPPAPDDSEPAKLKSIPTVPPMSDEPASGVQGASYRVPSTNQRLESNSAPRSPAKKPLSAKKPTILDTFDRKKP